MRYEAQRESEEEKSNLFEDFESIFLPILL